jgi:cysteine desulfurase/selenocysteine lyase
MFDKTSTRFPIKATGCRFLSHCGFAPFYANALKAQIDVAMAQSREPHIVLKQYSSYLRRFRDTAARVLKASAAEIAFVKNTSEALNMVASGFRFASPDDEVISYKHEYPANHYPWVLQQRKGRCKLKLLENCAANGKATGNLPPVGWTMEQLEKEVNPNTRIIALSHVQFTSGHVTDIQAVGELCRKRGICFVLDAAQSLGCLPIYPKECAIDVVVSSGWKWLMGPVGTGVLYMAEDFRKEKCDLTIVGADSMRQATNYLNHDWDPVDSAKVFEYSTSPVSLATALEVCLREVTLAHTPEAIRDEIFRLQDMFLDRLNQDHVRPVFSPTQQRSSILSLIVPGDAHALSEELAKDNIICSDRGTYLRIAPHFYNTEADVDTALDALAAVIGRQ